MGEREQQAGDDDVAESEHGVSPRVVKQSRDFQQHREAFHLQQRETGQTQDDRFKPVSPRLIVIETASPRYKSLYETSSPRLSSTTLCGNIHMFVGKERHNYSPSTHRFPCVNTTAVSTVTTEVSTVSITVTTVPTVSCDHRSAYCELLLCLP